MRIAEATKPYPRLRRKGRYADERALWIMLIPVVAYFVFFRYLPMAGVAIALKKFSPFLGFSDSPWNGLEYFRQFFASIYFPRVLRNTLVIGAYYLLFAFPAPVALALMLNSVASPPMKRTFQTITLLPHFVSFVVIAGLAVNMLSPRTGVVNLVIQALGGESVFFMQKQEYFKGIYTAIRIFKETGYEAIVYLAALSAIDPTLYEAAEVDGAGRMRKLVSITLPSLIPTIVLMFLVRIGNIVSVSFEEVLLLQNDVILETSEVISTYVYRRGLIGADYSYATAVGLFETVVALALVIGSNAIARRFRDAASLW
ncbi:MAG: hypothetical protein A2Z99_15580 [Treponema sp. GWB1_62_6]|nr:MAG: hypothetical protein A2Z99_15580 [Treponema sp. GWB1_62_6]OHE65523.1 MAG: hypothetical protein A2001_10365 [Treponema sp. GWC1_61_84]OHE65626.1 MAG: hypothetical protein A2Y36_06870 [Treponema sp. GWA1_62_8]OHE72664.1 MAG: hypothetical protein A2413_12225 [Treponema sp. RIFOXYC1_FULL_61_9]HCM27726.1 hypothetical protein [Treponema sp.]